MGISFKKHKEDFVCEHCGYATKGDGYTNHCPHCLYSKHVDNNPGDREAECSGLMKPVSAEQNHGKQVIVHRCILCGHIKKNKVQKQDNFEALLSVIQ